MSYHGLNHTGIDVINNGKSIIDDKKKDLYSKLAITNSVLFKDKITVNIENLIQDDENTKLNVPLLINDLFGSKLEFDTTGKVIDYVNHLTQFEKAFLYNIHLYYDLSEEFILNYLNYLNINEILPNLRSEFIKDNLSLFLNYNKDISFFNTKTNQNLSVLNYLTEDDIINNILLFDYDSLSNLPNIDEYKDLFNSFRKGEIYRVNTQSLLNSSDESILIKNKESVDWLEIFAVRKISEDTFIQVIDCLDFFSLLTYLSNNNISFELFNNLKNIFNDDLSLINKYKKQKEDTLNTSSLYLRYDSLIDNITTLYKAIMKRNYYDEVFIELSNFSKSENDNLIDYISNHIISENLLIEFVNKLTLELFLTNKKENNENVVNIIKTIIDTQPFNKTIFDIILNMYFSDYAYGKSKYLFENYIDTGIISFDFFKQYEYKFINKSYFVELALKFELSFEEKEYLFNTYPDIIDITIFKNTLLPYEFFLKYNFSIDGNMIKVGIKDFTSLDTESIQKILKHTIKMYNINDIMEFYTFYLNENVDNNIIELPTNFIYQYLNMYFAAMEYMLTTSLENDDYNCIIDYCNNLTENIYKFRYFNYTDDGVIYKMNINISLDGKLETPLKYGYKVVNSDFTSLAVKNIKYEPETLLSNKNKNVGFYIATTIDSISKFYTIDSKIISVLYKNTYINYNKNSNKITDPTDKFKIVKKLKVIKEI